MMASGNNDGLGAQRTIEMRAACLGLGITTENCIVLDIKWVGSLRLLPRSSGAIQQLTPFRIHTCQHTARRPERLVA